MPLSSGYLGHTTCMTYPVLKVGEMKSPMITAISCAKIILLLQSTWNTATQCSKYAAKISQDYITDCAENHAPKSILDYSKIWCQKYAP